MNYSRFWTNHYLSTFAWWIVLILLCGDLPYKGELWNFMWWKTTSEILAIVILSFIRGYNFHKFKQRNR